VKKGRIKEINGIQAERLRPCKIGTVICISRPSFAPVTCAQRPLSARKKYFLQQSGAKYKEASREIDESRSSLAAQRKLGQTSQQDPGGVSAMFILFTLKVLSSNRP
jgi:hypothetical protein